jgi:hypothetical protein
VGPLCPRTCRTIATSSEPSGSPVRLGLSDLNCRVSPVVGIDQGLRRCDGSSVSVDSDEATARPDRIHDRWEEGAGAAADIGHRRAGRDARRLPEVLLCQRRP